MAIKRECLEVVNVLLMVIDGKDHYTLSHSLEVMDFSQLLARRLKLSVREQETIRLSSFLHDVGKITVLDTILQKPGTLLAEEFLNMKTHAKEGAKIIGQIGFFRHCVEPVLCHHERLDGSGYPDGRKAGDIPIAARILAVSDVYSALRANRPYRSAFTPEQTRDIMLNMKGTLDPELVDIILELMPTGYK